MRRRDKSRTREGGSVTARGTRPSYSLLWRENKHRCCWPPNPTRHGSRQMVRSFLVMEMVAMLLATCSHATASGSSAAVLLAGDYTSTNAGRLHRLRGGFEAVMPLKPANLGTPNQWSGMNFGKIPRSFVKHSKPQPHLFCSKL